MRKKMSRFIAGFLFACMVAGSIPAEDVYGADNVAGNAQESEQNQSGVEGYTNVTGEEKQPGGIEEIQDDVADNDQKAEEESSGEAEDFSIDNEETDVSENEIDIAASDEDSIVEETTGESEKTEKAEINFVYIESPYLETPGTQRIVFAFDQEIAAAESVTLTVEDELGIREEWGLAQQTAHLYLFEKEYTGDSYTGTYHAVSLNFYGEQNESIILADAGIEAEFGVNEKYDGIEELQPVEDSAVEESGQRQVDASVVTIDENGVTQAQDSIADALNAVSAQTASENGISTFSADASSKTRSARSGDIVVALDPGHDANDAGAQGFGLREENLTLKIANYCKEELEKYSGVSVYMTRTTAACPYNCTSAGSCISQRAKAAAAAGAQIFVSFHLNSSVSSSANGAEIIVPNYNWKYEVGAQGHALAEKILAELTALGLANRGIYSKDTTINERYPDGSLSDYFSVMIYNKENGIPGIIVEHAFLSNSGDVNRFLTTEEGLKQLGVADATGIANYLGLTKLGQKVDVKEGTYTIESILAPGMAVAISNQEHDNGALAILESVDSEKSAQRFEIINRGNGYYNIIAEHSGKALEVKDGISTAGVNVQQSKLDVTSEAQKWCFIDAGDGNLYIRSALGTYIDVKYGATTEGTEVWTYDFNGSSAQKWTLTESNYHPIENGTYSVANGKNVNYVLEIASQGMSDGSNAQLGVSNSISSQRYEITYVGGGYYKIIAEHSDKSLDISGGSSENGANVQQYTWNGSAAQLWKFVNAGNGNWYIRSKLGTVLDLGENSPASGINIQMWEMDADITQTWKLTKTEYRPVADGTYTIANITSDQKVLEVVDYNVQLGMRTGVASQVYDFEYIGNGYYKIMSKDKGKVLDVYGGSSQLGANLWTYEWNNSDAQLWKLIDAGGGSFYIKSKLGTVIDLKWGATSVGTNAQMYSLNGSDAQKWILNEVIEVVNERPLENGTYTIRNSSNSSKVLDVSGGGTNNGAKIQLYQSNETSPQRFEIFYVGSGYYRILAEHSGKSLDIVYGSALSGASVQQYDWNNSEAQLWRIIESEDGAYFIQSKLGTVLGVDGDGASSGTNVLMQKLSEQKSQKWSFEKTNYRPVQDDTYILRNNSKSEYVFDVKYGSLEKNAEIWLYSDNSSASQMFEVQYIDNGYYKIISKQSGLVLESQALDYKPDVGIEQQTWSGADNQLWKFIPASNGSYYIRSKTGTVVDVQYGSFADGAKLQMYMQNGTSAQEWMLSELNENTGGTEEPSIGGVYILRSALNVGKVLDIAGGSTSDKANVQIYQQNDSKAQYFVVTRVSGDYYKIESMLSGKVLDVSGGSAVSGANVQQYTWNGSDAQLWKFIDAGNDQFYIQSKLGTVLEVAFGSAENGANVQTYECNNSVAQKWILDGKREELYSIMGKSDVKVAQMVKFFNTRASVTYPYSTSDAPTIERFCEMYIEESEAEGVKAEVAFCQAMLETGFLKFGGDVDKNQYNFAGLGAVGNGVKGESFPDVRTGIRAHVQHLKAYASTDPLNNPKVDTRFDYVKRGVAEYVQWLGMNENPNSTESIKYGWAAAKNYGYNIVEYYIIPLKEIV